MTARGGELVRANAALRWAGMPVPRALWDYPEAREAIRGQLRHALDNQLQAARLAAAGRVLESVVCSPRPGEPLRVELAVPVRRAA